MNQLPENVVRYPALSGTREERRAQLKAQAEQFSRDAKDGKVLCLSDLIGNAESFYVDGLGIKKEV